MNPSMAGRNRIFATNDADRAIAEKALAELSDLATVQVVGEQHKYLVVVAPDTEVRRWVDSFDLGHAVIEQSSDLYGSRFLRANISVELFNASRS